MSNVVDFAAAKAKKEEEQKTEEERRQKEFFEPLQHAVDKALQIAENNKTMEDILSEESYVAADLVFHEALSAMVDSLKSNGVSIEDPQVEHNLLQVSHFLRKTVINYYSGIGV